MKNETTNMKNEIIKSLINKLGIRDATFAFRDINFLYIIKEIFGEDSDEMLYILNSNNLKLSNLPSKIDEDGNKIWKNDKGLYHRVDGPAIENADRTKQWYINGLRHREDGPAIEYVNGRKEWYINGNRHREDGPAIEGSNGDKHWYLNGVSHREDGPAKEYAHGYKEWWVDGEECSEKDFLLRNISMEELRKLISLKDSKE